MNRTGPWYTTVGWNGNPAPTGPWSERGEAAVVLGRWLRRKGYKSGELVAMHLIQVYAYKSRAAARRGDISDEPGRNGCVGIHDLYDFLSDSTDYTVAVAHISRHLPDGYAIVKGKPR